MLLFIFNQIQPYFFINFFFKKVIFLEILKSIIISGFLLFLPLITISSTRISSKLLVLFFFNLFFFLLILSFSKNIWFFFFIYEFFFLPSFLLVFFSSPNSRFWSALVYFTIWTQIGSLLLMFFFINLYRTSGLFILSSYNLELSHFSGFIVFLGLGIKIPVWPFHFWLTKTHVEAPSFFSIYLSGFLVKTAVLGFFLVINLLSNLVIFCGLLVFFLGCVDSTLKFICQVDLKKLVAYTTIQEMNMIGLLLFLTKHNCISTISMFIVLHTILSTLFFYIVDIFYKKYRTRLTLNLTGVFNKNYILGLIILFSVILFNAIPFTIKFFIEVCVFLNLLDFNLLSFIILCFFLNFVGSLFFFKIWSNVLFGSFKGFSSYSLSLKEVFFPSLYLIIFLSLTIYY